MARGNKRGRGRDSSRSRGSRSSRGGKRGSSRGRSFGPSRDNSSRDGPSWSKRGRFDNQAGPGRFPPKPAAPESPVESSEDETPDPYKQLLTTIAGSSQSRLVAAESEESEISEDESDLSDEESTDVSDEEALLSKDEKLEHDEENDGATDEEIEDETNVDGGDIPSEDDNGPLVEEDEEDDEIGEEEIESSQDPFTQHLQWELSPELLESLSVENLKEETHSVTWPVLGKINFTVPTVTRSSQSKPTSSRLTLVEPKKYAPLGVVPKRLTDIDLKKLYIKQQIQGNIQKANSFNLNGDSSSVLTPLQSELFSIINNYQDVYYPERNHSNGEQIRFTYCLHVVNHVLKTRTKVLHHNARMVKKKEAPDEFRDQGLVRPKVLILVPFKDAALRTVNMITSILLEKTKGTVMNQKRFFEDFSGNEIAMPHKKPRPEDYERTFSGNTDDSFRIGLSVTKKCMKLYAEFYSSDIIIASPLGLRMVIGAEGEVKRDFDFLASLELIILDQADIFLQQNWDHMIHIWDHVHLQPRSTHDADFSRLRLWALAGHARYYRQTLLFSSLQLPELAAIANRRCHNYAGKARVSNPIKMGSICHIIVQLPQVFHRLEAHSLSQAIDARFEMFVSKILPQFKESIMSHSLIYVPSYFDYVRIRNHFKREDLSFVQICEYAKDGKIARARDMFFHNSAHFLLYSERFHFFRRVRIKGIRHLIFYQPPVYPHFFSEFCNFMQEANQNRREEGGSETNMSVTVLYSKYDAQRLAGIVGSDRAAKMLSSDRKVHMMVTGE